MYDEVRPLLRILLQKGAQTSQRWWYEERRPRKAFLFAAPLALETSRTSSSSSERRMSQTGSKTKLVWRRLETLLWHLWGTSLVYRNLIEKSFISRCWKRWDLTKFFTFWHGRLIWRPLIHRRYSFHHVSQWTQYRNRVKFFFWNYNKNKG